MSFFFLAITFSLFLLKDSGKVVSGNDGYIVYANQGFMMPCCFYSLCQRRLLLFQKQVKDFDVPVLIHIHNAKLSVSGDTAYLSTPVQAYIEKDREYITVDSTFVIPFKQ